MWVMSPTSIRWQHGTPPSLSSGEAEEDMRWKGYLDI